MQTIMKKIKGAKEKLYATGFFHVFGSNIFNQMIGFLSGVLLVRILPKTEYGIYSYAYSIVNFFLIFNGLGVVSALLQTCSEAEEKKLQDNYYGYANRIGALFDFFLAMILCIVSITVPFRIQGAGQLLVFMSFLPMGMLIFQLKTTYFRATLHTKEFSYSNSGNAFFLFLFSVIGALLFKATGLVVGQTLAYFFSAFLITKIFKLPIHFHAKYIDTKRKKDFLKLGIVMGATNAVSQLMNLLDVFILGILIPDGNVIASYKIATTIPLALTFIPSAIITYVYPYFAKNRDNKQWLQINFKRLLLIVSALNGIIACLLIVLSPIIIKVVFGKQYMDAIIPFCILSLDFFFSCTFSAISGNLLVTQRKLKFNFWRGVVMGILNLIGNIVFITLWGSVGAAISTFSVGVVSGLVTTWKMNDTIKKIDTDTRKEFK